QPAYRPLPLAVRMSEPAWLASLEPAKRERIVSVIAGLLAAAVPPAGGDADADAADGLSARAASLEAAMVDTSDSLVDYESRTATLLKKLQARTWHNSPAAMDARTASLRLLADAGADDATATAAEAKAWDDHAAHGEQPYAHAINCAVADLFGLPPPLASAASTLSSLPPSPGDSPAPDSARTAPWKRRALTDSHSRSKSSGFTLPDPTKARAAAAPPPRSIADRRAAAPPPAPAKSSRRKLSVHLARLNSSSPAISSLNSSPPAPLSPPKSRPARAAPKPPPPSTRPRRRLSDVVGERQGTLRRSQSEASSTLHRGLGHRSSSSSASPSPPPPPSRAPPFIAKPHARPPAPLLPARRVAMLLAGIVPKPLSRFPTCRS
ncbi:uncharacterized protein AMSG_09868, partial [Thecamonas trahens ATCC 50062]